MNTSSNRSSSKGRVFTLTLLAMLTAVLVVLSLVNIPQPAGLSITFNMIPVAIAAIALGVLTAREWKRGDEEEAQKDGEDSLK